VRESSGEAKKVTHREPAAEPGPKKGTEEKKQFYRKERKGRKRCRGGFQTRPLRDLRDLIELCCIAILESFLSQRKFYDHRWLCKLAVAVFAKGFGDFTAEAWSTQREERVKTLSL
jgi:hypothetical protein